MRGMGREEGGGGGGGGVVLSLSICVIVFLYIYITDKILSPKFTASLIMKIFMNRLDIIEKTLIGERSEPSVGRWMENVVLPCMPRMRCAITFITRRVHGRLLFLKMKTVVLENPP